MKEGGDNEAAAVQPSVEEQLEANQEQLAATRDEVSRLLAAQNGADAHGGGDVNAAAQQDANARGGGSADAAAQQDANARGGGGGNAQPARDWDRNSSHAGSGFSMLAPPPHKTCAGSFSKPDPNSKWTGLSKIWDRALTADPAKAAKIFGPGEAAKLAILEVIGCSILAIQAGLRDCVNTVSPDNEVVCWLLDFNDDLDLVHDTIRREINNYTFRWNHPTRYAAIKRFIGYYERDTLGSPACMLETNINLEYQIILSDLKAIKKEFKQDAPCGARGARESRGGGRAGGDTTQARNCRDQQASATGAAANQGPAQPQHFGRGGGPSAAGAGAASG